MKTQKFSEAERRRRREQAERLRRAALEQKAAFLRTADLCARWGVSRVTIWNWERQQLLPRSVPIGPNSRGWAVSVIEEYERQRAGAGSPEAA